MTKYKALIDVSKGAKGIDEDVVYAQSISGQMTYLPMCCSVGVLENLAATKYNPKAHGASIDNPLTPSTEAIDKIKKAEYIDEIIRAVGGQSFIAPLYFTRWYAMSLMMRKFRDGTDRHGKGAYSGFKSSQILLFDRLLEDKHPDKGFKYQYNMTYAISHMIEWLRENGSKYGDVKITPAVPGGHGARVYGCAFTGDVEALEKYCDERIELVRGHYLAVAEIYTKRAKKAKDTATPATKGMKNFVGF